MPEYPEVAVLIQNLKREKLLGQKIIDINFIDSKVLKNSTPKSFKSFILNETFKDIYQIGKLIVIILSHNKYLTIHLRMEGKLFFVDSKDKTQQFTMIEFNCGKKKLIYTDFRKFGTFYIYENEKQILNSQEVKKMGIQPFDKKLTARYLIDSFKNKTCAIKSSLLDQSIIAGIGNIYADEILFACKINPLRKTNKVSLQDCQNIVDNVKKILNLAIKNYGTTVFSYKFAPNHSGEFQKYLKVYSRENQPCVNCKTPIKKIKLGGRGTCYCPKCQSK